MRPSLDPPYFEIAGDGPNSDGDDKEDEQNRCPGAQKRWRQHRGQYDDDARDEQCPAHASDPPACHRVIVAADASRMETLLLVQSRSLPDLNSDLWTRRNTSVRRVRFVLAFDLVEVRGEVRAGEGNRSARQPNPKVAAPVPVVVGARAFE